MSDASTSGRIQVEETDADHVALVRIDRPEKRNALDQATREALMDALDRTIETGTRAIVLTGSGKMFAAGADLAEMRERTVEEQRSFVSLPRMYETIGSLDAPVVAAINGHALGAGLELALACDVRVASREAKVGSPEVRLGLIPGGGATQRLPRLVGLGEAMRLVLTGDTVEAPRAREIGLVEEVAEPDQVVADAVELAGRIARWSPVALAHAKKALLASAKRSLDEGLKEEADRFVEVFASEDAQEGIEAFLEDREPEFRGR